MENCEEHLNSSCESNSQKRKIPLSDCNKIYIQREYSKPLGIKFSDEFPIELENYIEKEKWAAFICDLNGIYAEAEKVTKNSCVENIIGLFTCYLSRICSKTIWNQKLIEVEKLIAQANEYFVENGIYVSNPREKGFRVIEISLLDEPAPKRQEKFSSNNTNLLNLQPR